MSNKTVKLQLAPYLAQWCLHHWGSEDGIVRFPKGSNENEALEALLKRPPPLSHLNPPQGNVEIEIPDFRHVKGSRCWLTPRGRHLLTHVIQVRFRVQLWNDLYSIRKLMLPIADVIYEWMLANGIEENEKNWQAIRQIYYRQRKKYGDQDEVKES